MNPCEDGDHDWEITSWEHECDDVPVSQNPVTDVIHYRMTATHTGVRKCVKCGVQQAFSGEPCDCAADEPDEDPRENR